MKKSHFLLILFASFASVVFLSIAWEFWLEKIFAQPIYGDTVVESPELRLDYVISIAIFSFISLIFPSAIGCKMIDDEEAMKQEIRRYSEEDYLTALYNRRKIHTMLESEIKRASRYDSVFTVIFIDVDDFKTINDTHGHNVGDRVLVQFADILMKTKRESDIAGRWGGEEFLIVCPETNIEGASFLAEKLRACIEKNRFESVDTITASFGLVSFSKDDNVRTLMKRADEALYTAKKAGKNKVVRTR